MSFPRLANLFGTKKNKLTRSHPPTGSLYGNNAVLETSASQAEKKLLEDEEFINRMILEFGNTNSVEKQKYKKQLNNIHKRLNEIRRGYAYKQPGGRRTRKQRRRRMTRRRR
jgi:hypothetical protein